MNVELFCGILLADMETTKKTTVKIIIARDPKKRKPQWTGVIVYALLLIFVFNFFDWNRPYNGYTRYEVKVNREIVAREQKGDVAKIEKDISLVDASLKNGDSLSGKRAWYMERFRNCVVVGDSLTEGLSVYQWLSKKQVFSSVGGSLNNDEKLFRKAAATYPKAAFFAFGMNDTINYRGDAKAFIKRYEKLLDGVHKKSPKTKIYICSISTPTNKAIKQKKSLGNYKKFNKALQEMCDDKGYTYVDASRILPTHKDLYAGDGIHAASAYYPMWMDKMIEKANL